MRLALGERASPPHAGAVELSEFAAQDAEPVPSIDRFGWWLVLICAVAFILRLVVVYQGRNSALTGDGFEYSIEANLNARGEWFVSVFANGTRPDALHPPAWALVLTIWAWLGQHSWLAQQTLAAVVGTLTVGAVGLAGRRIGGVRVGLIAAGIAALYPGLWVYERAILSETLLLLGIAVMILVAYRFWARPSARRAAVLGLMCGLLALTRSEQILVFAVVVAPLILAVRHIGWRRRIGWLALATLCVVVVVTPWTIYNLGRFKHPVLLSNNFGAAVEQGNCDTTYYGPYTGAYSAPCLHRLSGDQSVENATALHEGLSYLDHHLGRLPVVLFAREGRAFGFWAPFQQVHLDAEWESGITGALGTSYLPTAIWVNRLALFGFWLLVIPAAAGVVVLRRRRIPVYPLLGFFAIVAVTVATTYGETRYRAAVEVPLVLLAAVGLSAGLPPRGDPSGLEPRPDNDWSRSPGGSRPAAAARPPGAGARAQCDCAGGFLGRGGQSDERCRRTAPDQKRDGDALGWHECGGHDPLGGVGTKRSDQSRVSCHRGRAAKYRGRRRQKVRQARHMVRILERRRRSSRPLPDLVGRLHRRRREQQPPHRHNHHELNAGQVRSAGNCRPGRSRSRQRGRSITWTSWATIRWPESPVRRTQPRSR